MKLRKIVSISLCVLLTVSLLGCGKKEKLSKTAESFTKITEIAKDSRIFEVNYDKVDYDYGDKFWADNNDNWGGGCTAVTKQLSNGHRIVGRNMDLNIADKAAYIVRTNETKDRYKTVGLAYTFRDYAPLYDEVKEKGISDNFKKILPFLCDDVMNDKGLHIEVNMRHGECDFAGNDQFSLKGTNPDGDRRVHMFELPRYMAEHCKTVVEAKEYVKTLDIYSKIG
ncbi:MAG: linear amide C-N hydrolase, partial [Clostridia bacterium]|nr:linear amide C-N hydrolase [Clostridia bacterium]